MTATAEIRLELDRLQPRDAVDKGVPSELYKAAVSTLEEPTGHLSRSVTTQRRFVGRRFSQSVFSRCLLSCPWVPLWRCYLRYIKMTVDAQSGDGARTLRQV